MNLVHFMGMVESVNKNTLNYEVFWYCNIKVRNFDLNRQSIIFLILRKHT